MNPTPLPLGEGRGEGKPVQKEAAMNMSANGVSRRNGVTAVHSLHRFAFSVPDLDVAERFYSEFGLDVRRDATRIDLHAFGNAHCWGSVFEVPGKKKLQFLSFGVFEDDFAPLLQHLDHVGVARTKPHPPDRGAAPTRSRAGRVHPRRMSHVLLFSSDVLRSVKFYGDALGLRLSDRSGEIIAFMHGAHSSDHHLVAFAKSEAPGYHHSSWDVASIDDIGLGMQHMVACGHVRGWGIGRHVIGSNYFYYVQDPWGSFAEYSYDIDFIGADVDWPAADHPPEDSFYVWGPPPPDYFIQNHEVTT